MFYFSVRVIFMFDLFCYEFVFCDDFDSFDLNVYCGGKGFWLILFWCDDIMINGL